MVICVVDISVDSQGRLKVTGKEWACFRLGHAGTIDSIDIDTSNQLKISN